MPTQVSPLKRAVQSALRNITPVRLWLWLSALWFCSLIFGLAAIGTIQQHVHAVKTIAADAAPSVFSAYEIKSGIERMDAALVNELLYSPGQIEAVEMEDNFEK